MSNSPFDLNASARRDLVQAIHSHYYNITDSEGQPVGGLLVFLDRAQAPVRAELQLFDELPEESATKAIRQACHLLGERYSGSEPISLQISESFILGDPLQVELAPPGSVENTRQALPWKTISLAVGGLVLLVGLITALPRWFGGSGTTTSSTVATPAAGDATADPAETPATAAEAAPSNSSAAALPPSKNANPNLKIGDTVHATKINGEQVYISLQSQPNPEDQYKTNNFLGDQENETALIVDGPQFTQGNTDTIVWWRVRLADNTEAWAAANTSDHTLLELQ